MTIHTTYSNARANLAGLLQRASDELEIIVIQRRNGKDVAMISADELNGLVATAHLLASPANAERLLESIEQSRQGKGVTMTLEELRAWTGLYDPEA
jgi:antitoxin YefM